MNLPTLRTGHSHRRGFSVLELLIATTIAMVILLIVTKWFRDLSKATAQSRALVEMSGQMRSVIAQLEADMRGATYPRGAMPGTVAPMGYIQYVEGMASDRIPAWPVTTLRAQTVPPAPPGTIAPGTTLVCPDVIYRSGTNLLTATPSGTPAYFPNLVGAPNPLVETMTSRFGDLDDVLSLTTRQMESPFRGRMLIPNPSNPTPELPYSVGSIESPMAEVVWWAEGLDENGDAVISDGERQIRRRVFLIRPDLTATIRSLYAGLKTAGLTEAQALQIMLEQCDVSFHLEWDATINAVVAVANSLADLSSQRYTDNDGLPGFPTPANPVPKCKRITLGIPARTGGGERMLASLSFSKLSHIEVAFKALNPTGYTDDMKNTMTRYGEDVMISSVAAFDIRIYDDMAPLWGGAGFTVNPGDPAYPLGGTKVGQGAFVDLNYGLTRDPQAYGTGSSFFSGPPSQFSGFFRVNAGGTSYTHLMTTYDTCAPIPNNAFDGVDSDSDGVIDDEDELLAELPPPLGTNMTPGAQYVSPPYPITLRALQVTLRTYDPDSRQIRQMKASAAFTND